KKMTGRSFHSGWRLLHNGPREAKPAFQFIAGWSSPVARQAHNLKVRGSNPLPATKLRPLSQWLSGRFRLRAARVCCAEQYRLIPRRYGMVARRPGLSLAQGFAWVSYVNSPVAF